MTREAYLKELIRANGFTAKEFAQNIDMPYSTLLTILNDGKIGKASVDNVIKICQGLNITVQDLQAVVTPSENASDRMILSEHEKQLIQNYRQKKDLQKAIDILLFSE